MLILDADDQVRIEELGDEQIDASPCEPAVMTFAREVVEDVWGGRGPEGTCLNAAVRVPAGAVNHPIAEGHAELATHGPIITHTPLAQSIGSRSDAVRTLASAATPVVTIEEGVVSALDAENPVAPLILDADVAAINSSAVVRVVLIRRRQDISAIDLIPRATNAGGGIETSPVVAGGRHHRRGLCDRARRHVGSQCRSGECDEGSGAKQNVLHGCSPGLTTQRAHCLGDLPLKCLLQEGNTRS